MKYVHEELNIHGTKKRQKTPYPSNNYVITDGPGKRAINYQKNPIGKTNYYPLHTIGFIVLMYRDFKVPQ